MNARISLLLIAASGLLRAAETPPGTAPYPASPVIADIAFDWSTHRREAQGSDNWQLTWADDNQLYGAWGDGGGFGGTNNDGRARIGFARIEGDWNNFIGYNVWGGMNAEHPATFDGKSWGTISVEGILYSWVIGDEPDPTGPMDDGRRDHYRFIELARSTDHAATWTKAPWRWWREDNLIIPTFLQQGRDDAASRDGYVYAYFIRPRDVNVTQHDFHLAVHQPGAVFLARVRRDQLFAGRDAYEWFAGLTRGYASWGPLSAKQPVFENAEGTGWCLSASYNPGLKRYFLATEHGVTSKSQMAIYDAPEPWGPWTTVKYWTENDRFGQNRPGSSLEWKDNVFFLSFVPKWLSEDGREFTLSFTGAGGGKNNDSFNIVRGHFVLRDQPAVAAPPKQNE